MMNYVLVHGAWHGGWCWGVWPTGSARAARSLQPSLTGLAERLQFLSPAVELSTNISDSCDLVETKKFE
jgi:hypothetical protein